VTFCGLGKTREIKKQYVVMILVINTTTVMKTVTELILCRIGFARDSVSLLMCMKNCILLFSMHHLLIQIIVKIRNRDFLDCYPLQRIILKDEILSKVFIS
jgi:hypothetical protein